MVSVEERLARLEKEVEELRKARREEQAARGGDWISKITGSFKDDPEFEEILRLGREERQAEMPDDE